MESASSGESDDDSTSSSSSTSFHDEEGDSQQEFASLHEHSRNDDSVKEDEEDDVESEDDDSGEGALSSVASKRRRMDTVEEEEDLTLGERLARQQDSNQLKSSSNTKDRRQRRDRAQKAARTKLAELRRLKSKGSHDNDDDDDQDDQPEENATWKKKTITKKPSKHRPTEASSKRKDFFAQRPQVTAAVGTGIDLGAHLYKARDPRQSSLSGHFDANDFDNRYSFIHTMREQEIKELQTRIRAHQTSGQAGNRLRKRMKMRTSPEALKEDKEKLRNLMAEHKQTERNQLERAAQQRVKREIRDKVANGQSGAYFLKRRERKELVAKAKLEEWDKRKKSGSGGPHQHMDKALEKKRKRNKSRDAQRFGGRTGL